MKKIIFNLTFPMVLLVTLGLSSCHSHGEGSDHDHDHATEEHHEAAKEHHDHSDEIIMTPQQAKSANVKVEAVQAGDFQSTLHVSGLVMTDQSSEVTLVATQAGRVNFAKGLMSDGAPVKAGQCVATILPQNIENGDPGAHARVAYEAAKAEYERAKQLVADQIISQREFQQIKAAYEDARVTFESQMAHRSSGGVNVNAPKGGYMKTRLVQEGEYVAAGAPIAVIAQSNRLWIRADVPVSHSHLLPTIQSANFRMACCDVVYNLKEMGGRVRSYARSTEGRAAYVPLIFEFDNTGGIVAGSYADIWLLTGERRNVISIPLTALTESQGAKFVYLQTAADAYVRREVTLGESDGVRVEVKSGLKAGEKLVVSGAYAVRMAAATSAPPGHTHEH